MAEDPKEETTVEEDGLDDAESQEKNSKTWYPYITKVQFEKFLARLQSKMPEEINRDYIRAIIRTPSMIYRFLRGIEAMKLIDQDQKPTERMVGLVNAESRKHTIAEIMRDLYPDLMESLEKEGGDMADKDIVSFFRKETGMGNDSANKMKMFYKYLLSEAEFGDRESGDDTAAEAAAPDETPAPSERSTTTTPAETPAETPARNERRSSSAPAETPTRSERSAAATPAEAPTRNERGSGASRRGQRPSSQSNGGEPAADRGSSGGGGSRPLSEAQRAYLDTLKSVLRVNIDGDWDDDMIRLAFDRLERLFDRVRRG